ncbi:MAG: hypothetical protein H0T89_02280 [Deltaproteobacteria bacterium]|nr:hypothetical protein [Deltaproteobacteria bacterium]MDQ3297635.1 hypothetical protein [Myxococcota bacterium]
MQRIASSFLVLGLLTSCGPEGRTELILGVATDLRATDQINGVKLVVKRADDGVLVVDTTFQISGQPGMPDNLPGSYGIFSDGEETRLSIELTGTKDGAPMVTRNSVVSLVSEKTIFYRLGLTSACMTAAMCPEGQTCSEGVCVGLRLNGNQFPDFTADVVETLTCTGGTTFLDTTTNNPMPFSSSAGQCPAGLCREGTCLTPPPSCSAASAVQSCDSAVAACNAGCATTDCNFNFGGTTGCDQIPGRNLSSTCLAAVCALVECASSAEAGWGSLGTDGTCGLLGCDFEGEGFEAACLRAEPTTPGDVPAATGIRSWRDLFGPASH